MPAKLPRKQNRQPLPAARPQTPGPTAGGPTPELCDRICAGIAKGLHPHVAAELAGVSAQTFESWLEQGEKGIEPYAILRTAIAHADAKLHSRVISPLLDTLETNPPMALKFAERRWPNEWAPPSPQKDEAAFQQAFAINIHISSREKDDGPVCNLNHSHMRECYGYPPAVILPEYNNVTREPEQPPRDRSSIHTRPDAVPEGPLNRPSARSSSRTDDLNAEIRGRGLIFPLRPEKKRPDNGGNGDPENWS